MASVSKNLVVVGSAPCSVDYRVLIQRADLVLRFNECKQFGGHVGTHTDILCVNNVGAPARRFIATRPLLDLEAVRSARLWFPRHAGVCVDHVSRMMQDHPGLRSQWEDLDFQDYAAEIVTANDLGHCSAEYFTQDLNKRVYRTLEQLAAQPFFAPSTGMLALARVLEDPAFADHRVHLIGFGFSGWPGHPWQAERALVANYVWLGRLIYYPV